MKTFTNSFASRWSDKVPSATNRLVLAAGCAVSISAAGLGASFTGVGFLPNTQASYAWGVSADGVVVGESTDLLTGGSAEAFRWTESGGMVGLGFLPGANISVARAISADGVVIMGYGVFQETSFWGIRWSAGGTDNLGWTFHLPRALSADGSVATGTGTRDEPGEQACRWTAATGRILLGVLPGGLISDGNGISADGTVIVGGSQAAEGTRAFRWTAADGMVSLGVLPGHQISDGLGISADGTTLVGYCYSSELGSEPFRWTADAGMQPLGRLADGGNAVALAASGDGSVIVGYSESAVALVWDLNHGMRNLRDVLTQRYDLDLTGWELREAVAISPDGSIIVGQGMRGGRPEGWIARVEDLILPELRSELIGGELIISWPAPSPGWRLEAITGLTDDSTWTEVPGPYHTGENGRISSTGALPDGNRFYRLAKP